MWAEVTESSRNKDQKKVRLFTPTHALVTAGGDAAPAARRHARPRALVRARPLMRRVFSSAQIDAVIDKYFHPEVLIMRPSGNSMDHAAFKKQKGSKDLMVDFAYVSSVDSIRLMTGNRVALVIFTEIAKFTFKGVPNDGKAIFTATLEKVDGSWNVAFMHRTGGFKVDGFE